jgi:FkbM family methyltransferase
LETKLRKVESFANATRLKRFISMPHKYWHLMLTRHLIKSPHGVLKKIRTFWGDDFSVLLPASSDIYLSGGKTHDSEIRLCKFLIKNLKDKDIVFDIGAHFGFFSIFMSSLVKTGKVYSFEASKINYNVLQENALNKKNIQIRHLAISDRVEKINFYEFPVYYSEYNSTNQQQYEDEKWFQDNKPTLTVLDATTIDEFCASNGIFPKFIKMDVEGAEDKAIRGAIDLFSSHSVILAMEYLAPERGNESHKSAVQLLKSLHYHSYIIDGKGLLAPELDLDAYLRHSKLESDNIIFIKK